MTWKGLHPLVDLVTTAYQTGVRLTAAAMTAIEAQIGQGANLLFGGHECGAGSCRCRDSALRNPRDTSRIA